MNFDDEMNDEIKIDERTLKRYFVQARLNKICECKEKSIKIDLISREIECSVCGARLDPFDTLEELYRQESRYWLILKGLRQQCEELEKWLMNNKMGKTLRSIAAELRQNRLPCCPHCGEAIDLTAINTYCSKEYAISKYNERFS